MNAEELFRNIQRKKSFLCVGLDTDFKKIPKLLLDSEYPVFEFNKHIIDATEDLAVAYKPNLAFYEKLGAAGHMSLEMTVSYLREHYPDVFIIADAKRGDIGRTSLAYAKSVFEFWDSDSVTVAPYMGSDSVGPFIEWCGKGKGVYINQLIVYNDCPLRVTRVRIELLIGPSTLSKF